jgi:hypothetical protein
MWAGISLARLEKEFLMSHKLPNSVVTVRSQFAHPPSQQVEVSPAEVNSIIMGLLATGEWEDIIVSTPGWGVRVFAETSEGHITAIGRTEQEAQDRVNQEFDLRDQASAASAFIGFDAQGRPVHGVQNAHLLAPNNKRDWDFDPEYTP